MNQTLETFLLPMIVPATALAVLILLERRRTRDREDDALEPTEETIAQPRK
jgi:hypothetical protein